MVWAITNKGVYQFEDSQWRKIFLYPEAEDFHCRQILETDSGLYVNYGDRFVFQDKAKHWKVLAENHSRYPYFNRLFENNGQIFINTKETIYRLENYRLVPVLTESKGRRLF